MLYRRTQVRIRVFLFIRVLHSQFTAQFFCHVYRSRNPVYIASSALRLIIRVTYSSPIDMVHLGV